MAKINLSDTSTPRNGNASDPDWKRVYQKALFETDLTKIRARIFDAQFAVLKRSTELVGRPLGREHHDLDDAWRVLYRLESESFSKDEVA
jgi:hypothetical protein